MTVRAGSGEITSQFKALVSLLVAILIGVCGFLATAAYSDIKEDVSGLKVDRRADHDTLIQVKADVAYIRATLDQWEPAPRGGN